MRSCGVSTAKTGGNRQAARIKNQEWDAGARRGLMREQPTRTRGSRSAPTIRPLRLEGEREKGRRNGGQGPVVIDELRSAFVRYIKQSPREVDTRPGKAKKIEKLKPRANRHKQELLREGPDLWGTRGSGTWRESVQPRENFLGARPNSEENHRNDAYQPKSRWS